jgi:beta-lactam-binding protein with PASTA domain
MLAFLLVAFGFALLACGSEDGDQAAKTETVEKTVTEQEPSDGGAPAEEDSGGPSRGGEIEVPDVEGEDHQLAQDTMQAAGLYNLQEEDATGQGRLLIVDRNWTVVEQDPPAGTKVSEDKTITLRSKKDGE